MAKPHMAVYLQHPAVILPAIVPYALFAGTVVTHGPILWSPRTFGGDMVALYFFGWALAVSAVVLLASAAGWVVLSRAR
jgi:hypothetical protein